ncbi:MAG: hypothetical protein RI996_321 [Candidatus Parcubacteria bacterium]
MSRFMRMMVMFDLPTETKTDKKNYTEFRRFLLKDGFDMMQYSVYTRLCSSVDVVDTHAKRVVSQAPKKGSIRLITITNKQFADMYILAGKKSTNERILTNASLSLF